MYRSFHSTNNRKSQALQLVEATANVTYSKLFIIVHVHYSSLGDDHIKICQKSFGLSTVSELQESYLPLNAKPQTTLLFHIYYAETNYASI